MPWNQNGGGWKSGGKGGGGGGPWGQGPTGGGGGSGGGGGGGGTPPPDLEELLRRSQDRLKQAMPGGVGTAGTIAILLVALVAVGFFGFTVRINDDERGVVRKFGAYDRELIGGLNFRLPYPIEEVTIVPFTRQNRVEVGFISQAGGGVFGASRTPNRSEESLMLSGDENIVDVNFSVFWNVKDSREFLFNVRNQGENADVTVKAVAESSMREIIGQNELQPILTSKRQEIQEAVKLLMQRTLDSYKAGIIITEVNMQKVDPPAEVIAAFSDVQTARQDQERARNEAESYANRIVPEARGQAQQIAQVAQGYREQTVAEAQGRTQRFLKVYEEYAKAPDVTRRRMYLETMERVLGGMDKIIIDDKAAASGVVPYLPLGEIARPGQTGGQR